MSTGNITVNTNSCNVPSVRWNVQPDLNRARPEWYTDIDNKTLVVVHGLTTTHAVTITGDLWIDIIDKDGHVVGMIRDRDGLSGYGIIDDADLELSDLELTSDSMWKCAYVLPQPLFGIVDVTGGRDTLAYCNDIFDAVQLAITRAGDNQ